MLIYKLWVIQGWINLTGKAEKISWKTLERADGVYPRLPFLGKQVLLRAEWEGSHIKGLDYAIPGPGAAQAGVALDPWGVPESGSCWEFSGGKNKKERKKKKEI